VRFALGLTFCAALALTSPATAGDLGASQPRLPLGLSAAPLGTGSDTALRLSNHFGLRFSADPAPLESAGERVALKTDIDLTPTASGAVLDYYPFRGGFRLSGGLRVYAEGPDAAASPGDITIGGLPFTPSRSATFDTGSEAVGYAPYGGVGLQSSFWEGRLELAFDVGVYYQGDTHAELRGDGSSAAAGGETESEDTELEDERGFLGFYPIVGLTAKYRF
jgi:hypothetical protein